MATSSVYDDSSLWDWDMEAEPEPHSFSSLAGSQSFSGSARLLPTATEVEAQVRFSGSSLNQPGDDLILASHSYGYQSFSANQIAPSIQTLSPISRYLLPDGAPRDTQLDTAEPWYPGPWVQPNFAFAPSINAAITAELWSGSGGPHDDEEDQLLHTINQPVFHELDTIIFGRDPSPSQASPTNPSDLGELQDKSYYRTECKWCHQVFTGKYSRGNCARHIHQKHRGVTNDNPQHLCRVCKREFNRKDAKRKHEWKQHRLPDCQPSKRGPRSTQMVSRQSSVKNDGGSSIIHAKPELPPRHDLSIPTSDIFQVPKHSKHAHAVFGTIKARLDPLHGNGYTFFCQEALNSWERIVTNMRLKGFDTSTTFTQVLRDLSKHLSPTMQNQLSVSDTLHPSSAARDDFKSTQGTPTQTNRGKAPMKGQVRKETSQKSTQGNARPQELSKRARGKTAVTYAETVDKPKKQRVDCPVHKHHIMHGMQSPCKGCGKENMSAVRLHINRSNVHQEFVPFLERCKRCTTNVVSRTAMVDGGHDAGTCTQRDEPHGSLIPNWVRLYLDIFPLETQVPNPDPAEHGWLSPTFVRSIISGRVAEPSHSTQPSPNEQSPMSFLDEQLPAMGTNTTQNFLGDINQSMTPEYIAALDTILASALHLAARLLADRHVQTLRDNRPTEEIVAEYYMRLEYVRNATGGSSSFPGQLVIDSSNLGVPQQLPSDSGTGPSSRGHRESLTSSLNTSNTSLSSLDAPLSTFRAGPAMQNPEWFLSEPDAGAINCPPIPGQYQLSREPQGNPPDHWIPAFDQMLNAPGSSRTSQIVGELQEDMKMRLATREFTHMDSPPRDFEDEF